MMVESTELASFKPVMPLATPEEARKGWAAFEALKTALLTGDDYQQIAGKAFIKRSGFRKIAVYFGLSDRILEAVRVDREDKNFTWRMVVEAKAPNGRTSIGVAMCDSAEKKFNHLEHDVYATAHTRAKSRAISDMVAGGVVSAEEMEAAEEPRRQVDSGQAPAQGVTLPPITPPTPITGPWIKGALEQLGVDTGKVEIREELAEFVILKKGSLTDEEFKTLNAMCDRLKGTYSRQPLQWKLKR
jgi:hypothetical protein